MFFQTHALFELQAHVALSYLRPPGRLTPWKQSITHTWCVVGSNRLRSSCQAVTSRHRRMLKHAFAHLCACLQAVAWNECVPWGFEGPSQCNAVPGSTEVQRLW